MRPMRLSLILLSAVLVATVAACSSYTERTVYVPTRTATAPTTVVPAAGYYYAEPYHPAYVSY
jgi:hypothetical protein